MESSAPALRYLYRRLDNLVYPNDQNVLRKPATTPNSVKYKEMLGPFEEVKATENRRIMAETIDKVSWVQKLNQPKRLQAAAAFARFFPSRLADAS